jgi:hypothetical protein
VPILPAALFEQYVELVETQLEAGVTQRMGADFSWEGFLTALPATIAAVEKSVADAAEKGTADAAASEEKAEAAAAEETKGEDGGTSEDALAQSMGKVTLTDGQKKEEEEAVEEAEAEEAAEASADTLELLMTFTEFTAFKQLMVYRKQAKAAEAAGAAAGEGAGRVGHSRVPERLLQNGCHRTVVTERLLHRAVATERSLQNGYARLVVTRTIPAVVNRTVS